MDDAWVDELLRRLATLKAEHDAKVVAEIAAHGFLDDDGSTGAGHPPRPLYWHPWYRGKTRLWEWLESSAHELRLPVIPKLDFRSYHVDGHIDSAKPLVLELRKRKAFGPAPFVGEPFFYRWYVATDQFGRSISSEAQIVYPDPGWSFCYGGHL